VRPSSVEATETTDAIIHPTQGPTAGPTQRPAEGPAEATKTPQAPPPVVETPAPEVEKTPAQDASAA
jgi:hypothetical protein